ncbi:MAG: hypothetical protein P4M15_02775 [Alphaproteobacteria bacterium]|nr:hypothetical protein [Alphaproteobacteria bacterium]
MSPQQETAAPWIEASLYRDVFFFLLATPDLAEASARFSLPRHRARRVAAETGIFVGYKPASLNFVPRNRETVIASYLKQGKPAMEIAQNVGGITVQTVRFLAALRRIGNTSYPSFYRALLKQGKATTATEQKPSLEEIYDKLNITCTAYRQAALAVASKFDIPGKSGLSSRYSTFMRYVADREELNHIIDEKARRYGALDPAQKSAVAAHATLPVLAQMNLLSTRLANAAASPKMRADLKKDIRLFCGEDLMRLGLAENIGQRALWEIVALRVMIKKDSGRIEPPRPAQPPASPTASANPQPAPLS